MNTKSRSSRHILLGCTGVVALMLAVASIAYACVPHGDLVLTPQSGPAGSSVTAAGSGFPSGEPVAIHWGSTTGPVLKTVQGPGFTTQVTIPANAQPGVHTLVAATTDEHASHSQAPASFTVTGTPAPGPGPGPGTGTGPLPGPVPVKPSNPLVSTSPGAVLGGKTINGTGAGERLIGTPFDDVINCGGGNDVVLGGGGKDVINCGAGNDRVDGGAGNDKINGGSGKDRLKGGSGKDRISGASGNDKLAGGADGDRLLGGTGNDTLRGNSGRDRLLGGSGRDILFRDRLDILAGGAGRDRIVR